MVEGKKDIGRKEVGPSRPSVRTLLHFTPEKAITALEKKRVQVVQAICGKFSGLISDDLVEPGEEKEAQLARVAALHLFRKFGCVRSDEELQDLLLCTKAEIAEAEKLVAEGAAATNDLATLISDVEKQMTVPKGLGMNESAPQQDVIDAVSEETGVSFEEILNMESRETDKRLVNARKILIYCLRKLSRMDKGSVAKLLGRPENESGPFLLSYKSVDTIMTRRSRDPIRTTVLNTCDRFGVSERSLRERTGGEEKGAR